MRSGVTIVLTTHYLEEAQALCDTIAIINHGRVIACEPTGNLIGRLDRKTLVVTPQAEIHPPLNGFEDVTFAMRSTGRFLPHLQNQRAFGRRIARPRPRRRRRH